MALNVKLLRSSFEAVAPKGAQLISRFYALLFDRFPQVKPLFEKTPMAEQEKKLLRSLAVIVGSLEKPELLAPYLQGLGRMHVAYGALPAHYDAVGGCLLSAMAEVAGPLWTSELEAAWREAYGAVASIMLQGAAGPA